MITTKVFTNNAILTTGTTIMFNNWFVILLQEIHDLLSSWSHHITRCSRIFLRAPTYSKSTFHGGKNPILTKTDSRIRLVPFPTRRPTFKELHRVHELLATIECYGRFCTTLHMKMFLNCLTPSAQD
jgi:hypothetical protein